MADRSAWRARSFGGAAEQYDRTRPSYPDALIDDLLGDGAVDVLDVGCGTGIASRLFVARGCRLTGVEPDARMGDVAASHGVTVETAAFEEWDPRGRTFDLVIAAQSWHWVDADVGPAKVADVLRPGGRFAAFWNSTRFPADVSAVFADVYGRHAPHLLKRSNALGTDALVTDADGDALARTGRFETSEQWTYEWPRVEALDHWLDEVSTHSGHRVLPPAVLTTILEELRERMAPLGPTVDATGHTVALTARRSG